MNSNETSSPISPQLVSPNLSLGKRIRIRKRSSLSTSQEASLPSIPSLTDDNAWVSPFTLPPTSTLKGRPATEKLPVHDRAGSSAYYAAAWGSPYALPSPSQSPAPRLHRNQSLASSSPLATRRITLSGSSPVHTRQSSLPSIDSFVTANPIQTSPSQQSSSQRRHWLSESDGAHSSTDDGQLHTLTPTKKKFTRRILRRSLPRVARAHHTKDSTSTITPETFNGSSSVAEVLAQSERMDASKVDASPPKMEEPAVKDKPLPDLPTNEFIRSNQPQGETRPTLPLAVQSFQRPKRKIQVRGKTCIIALPFTDREEAGLPPLLTAEEKVRSKKKWIERGYPTHGFDVGSWHRSNRYSGGESRPTYPDPADLIDERRTTGASVSIPDPHEWQAWVDYLREEKLRALGVTPSTSDAPASTMSPFSSTMSTSRVSSAYPGAVPSPSVSALSTASHHTRMQTMSFSPLMGGPIKPGYNVTSSARGTPQPGGRPVHGYTQSIAVPGMNGRTSSPFELPGRQQHTLANSVRSPIDPYGGSRSSTPGHAQHTYNMSRNMFPAHLTPNGIYPPAYVRYTHGAANFSSPMVASTSQRAFTPRHVHNMQSMAYTPSPSMVGPQDYFGSAPTSNPQIDAIRHQQAIVSRQQQQVQAQIAHADHQRQMSTFPLHQAAALPLPETPKAVSPVRLQPEIMHPTPRSHRHNLSAALEHGMINGVATTDRKSSQMVPHKASSSDSIDDGDAAVKDSKTKSQQDQEATDEDPPILVRPEVLKDIEEEEDIITNPSMAATPLLLDDRDPFSNLQSFATNHGGSSKHSAKQSLPSLNVQAKEFNPSSAFSTNTFNFGDNPFAPKPEASYKSQTGHKSRISSLGLNVTAQPFVPIGGSTSLAMSGDTPIKSLSDYSTPRQSFDPRSSTFSFTSASFNVDAPEFKPAGQFSDLVVTPETGKDASKENSIFGDVIIDSACKPMRRGTQNKILTPIKSASRDGTLSLVTDNDLEKFGADGRAIAPVDRQKRARTLGAEGHDDIAFADSAPFKTLADESNAVSSIPERLTDEGSVTGETAKRDEASQNPVVATPVMENSAENTIQVDETPARDRPSEEMLSRDVAEQSAAESTANDGMKQLDSIVPERQIDEVVTTASQDHGIKQLNPPPVILTKDQLVPIASIESPQLHGSPASHSVKGTLSASADPFVFKPNVSEFVPKPTPSTQFIPSLVSTPDWKPNKTGLMASRFAATPSPPRSIEALATRESAPLPVSPERTRISDHPQEAVRETVEKPQPTELVNFKIPEADPRRLADGSSGSSAARSSDRDEHADHDRSSSVISRMDDMSYEELNAIMKQMDDDPDGGIIREGTPVEPTPLIDMRLPNNFRSDAPSPSPRRLERSFEKSRAKQFPGLGFDMSGVHQLGYNNSVDISDWGADLSPGQQEKLDSRAHYFDYHVNDLIDSVLENRLAPLEQSLQTIQHSIERTKGRPRAGDRRSRSSEQAGSEADDEDGYDAYEGYLEYRSKSPVKYKSRQDKIRAMVSEAMAESQKAMLSQIHDSQRHTLEELRSLKTSTVSPAIQDTLDELRALIEQARTEHTSTERSGTETSRDHVSNLEDRLAAAEMSDQQHKSLLDEARDQIQTLLKENKALHESDTERQNLRRENDALQETLDEYRDYRTQAKKELDKERGHIEQLTETLQQVREQYQDQIDSKDVLREQITNLQHRISKVMTDVHNDEDEWHKREHDLLSKNRLLQSTLKQEIHRRSVLESDSEKLRQEHAEVLLLRAKHDHTQEEISRMAAVIIDLQAKNKAHEDAAHQAQRELVLEWETREQGSTSKINLLQDELDTSRKLCQDLQSDTDARVVRLQSLLDETVADMQNQKAKHGLVLEDTLENHKALLAQARVKHTEELEEKLTRQEERLLEIKHQHARDMQHAAEDKHRIEQRLTHQAELAQDKVKHLTSKILSLEEQLEVTKSAARAAIQAASLKSYTAPDIPTPAPSVVASPPQRSSLSNASASAPTARGSELPEKISPQALRETILVLQEQLQQRESQIDKLEIDLAAVDRDAPRLVHERDAEIVMLRELLDVRLDDLQELIDACEQSDFDRVLVQDAAIRLRTSIQMDVQLKERALNTPMPNTNSLGNSLVSLTQSPRQMVAAAAWGNWRKVRDSSVGNVISDAVNGTPSRSASTSSSFLTGIMTPPPSMRTPMKQDVDRRTSSSRPLSQSTVRRTNTMSGPSSSGARPLRTISSQPRTLSSARRTSDTGATSRDRPRSSSIIHHRTGSLSTKPAQPSTPRQTQSEADFGDDIDEDASLLDDRESFTTGHTVRAKETSSSTRSEKSHDLNGRLDRPANTSNDDDGGGRAESEGESENEDGSENDIVEVIEEEE